jgi:hypothetical protein
MISKSIIRLVTIVLLLFFIGSILMCKHEPFPLPEKKKTTSDTGNYYFHTGPLYGSSGDTIKDSICFAEEILPIILSNCAKTGCHDANSGGGDAQPLISYSYVMNYVQPLNPNNSNLYQSITGNGQDIMPPAPNPPLSSAQIQLIYNWIMQGAKDNIDCGMGCDTTIFTFSGAVNPIMQNYCTGCHNGGTAGAGISLIGYSSVIVEVNNGKLWGSINHFTGFYGMPLNGPMLDTCHIKQIKKWIDAGALNN